MRSTIVAGNWKMHGTRASVMALLKGIKAGANGISGVKLIVFPAFVFLEQVENLLSDSTISWGAQNLSAETSGAFTGEVSANMLQEFGCRYVLVGHSERRTLYGEDNLLIAKKFIQAKQASLVPVLCLGETLQQRQQDKTFTVIAEQLKAILDLPNGIDNFVGAILAYEPVWAIGTGLSATPQQAQEVHAFIRQQIAKHDQNIAQQLSILYGGSVKSNNAAELFAMPDIDGGLVGGASLDAQEFLGIARAKAQY